MGLRPEHSGIYFCMNMRKNDKRTQGRPPLLGTACTHVLHIGLALIAPVLFWLILELERFPSLSLVAQARFVGMLEHVLAAAALLCAGAYLVERCTRTLHQRKK